MHNFNLDRPFNFKKVNMLHFFVAKVLKSINFVTPYPNYRKKKNLNKTESKRKENAKKKQKVEMKKFYNVSFQQMSNTFKN